LALSPYVPVTVLPVIQPPMHPKVRNVSYGPQAAVLPFPPRSHEGTCHHHHEVSIWCHHDTICVECPSSNNRSIVKSKALVSIVCRPRYTAVFTLYGSNGLFTCYPTPNTSPSTLRSTLHLPNSRILEELAILWGVTSSSS
jgi:hypothetical protein